MHARLSRTGLSPRRARSSPRWVGAALSCTWILAGCRSHSDTDITHTPPPARGFAQNAEQPAAPANTPAALRQAPLPQGPDWRNFPERVQPTAADETPDAAPSPAEPRNFSDELMGMLGNPADCLTPRADNGSALPLAISIDAQVMPSGAVASSHVTAATLARSELACITRRVEALHFPPPIHNAPFSVHGSMALQPTAAAKPALAPQLAAAPEQEFPPLHAAEGQAFLEPTPEPPAVPPAPAVEPSQDNGTPDNVAY